MYSSGFSNQFKKDYKRCLKRGLSESEIKEIMVKLMNGEELAPKHKLHRLSGNYSDCMECHIRPDWLLIFIQDEEAMHIEFVRTGSHSDLF